MAKDLLYRPELGYKKDYYTEGQIYDDANQDDGSYGEESSISKQDLVDGLIGELEGKFNFLPDPLINAYLSPYIGMKHEYENIKNGLEEDNKKDPDQVDPDPKDPADPPPFEVEPDPGIDPDDDLFDREDDIYIDIVDPKSDPAEIIKDSYYVNFLDIYEDYLNKMNVAISNYIYTTIKTVSQSLKDTSEEVSYATIDLENFNLSHLADYIVKSDITIGQVIRLHEKMFDIDETILHIKNIRISKEQAIRYNKIEEMEETDYLDVDSNVLLKESRRVAEKKYEENFYGLYKYLNSSVILLDESLKTITKQDKAKIIINNNEERDKKWYYNQLTTTS